MAPTIVGGTRTLQKLKYKNFKLTYSNVLLFKQEDLLLL